MKMFYNILISVVIVLAIIGFILKSVEVACAAIIIFTLGVIVEFYISTTPFGINFKNKK